MHTHQAEAVVTRTPRGEFVIRAADVAELEQILAWAAAEGWNPGRHDAACFYQADPEGFFMGELEGEPVAAISAVRYGEAFAFIGCFLVRPEYRYARLGWHLTEVCRRHIGARPAGLDGVVPMQRTYRRLGFHIAHRNFRFQGVAEGRRHPKVVGLRRIPFEELLRYDRLHFPAPRSAFLRAWIDQPEAVALGMLRESRLTGYGVLRRCGAGYKIGPLFADDARIAEQLFQSLCAEVPGETIALDVPEPNQAALDLVAAHRMTPVFETARMYLGPDPELALGQIYGITSYELG